MSKSMTGGAQKLMENFLESSSGKSALYDDNMNLVWSNYHEFFDSFDLKQVKSDCQLTSETALSVIADGVRAVLNITPIHKTVRTICAYVCIIKDSYDIYNLMSKTVISDFSNNLMNKSRIRIEKLALLNKQINEAAIELNEDIAESERLDRLSGLIREQDYLINAMFNETRFYIDTCYKELPENKEFCNLTLMFAAVFSYIGEDFRELKRKISLSVPEKDYYISKSGGMLLLAFLHLLRAHMTVSPLKSSVTLSAEYNVDVSPCGSFLIKLKTTLLPEDKTDESGLITSRAYRELAKKVIKYNYGGTFECIDTKKNMQTVFSVPVAKKNRGAMLNSCNVCYNNSESGIYRSYMREMLRREAEELTEPDL